jgi:hypothetical protein
VKVGSNRLDLADRDIVWKLRIQRLRRTIRGRPALGLDARDLREGMDTGIGSAGDREIAPAGEDAVEGLAHNGFHRPQTRLSCPAAKAGALVLERYFEPHVRRS